jgi:hypothetical protein
MSLQILKQDTDYCTGTILLILLLQIFINILKQDTYYILLLQITPSILQILIQVLLPIRATCIAPQVPDIESFLHRNSLFAHHLKL